MSNPNSQSFYTSSRRDGSSRRSEGQQLPPIKDHLPEFFRPELPAGHTYHTSHVTHNNMSHPRGLPPSQGSSSSPSTAITNPNPRLPSNNTSLYHSRPRDVPTPEYPYGMFTPGMEPKQVSEQPYFPSRPLRASNSDTSRKYPCDSCEERFDRPSGLEAHKRSHTQERPFTCSYPGCIKTFTVKSNLRRHEKTHTASSAFEPAEDDRQSSRYSSASKSSKPSSSGYYSSTSGRFI